LQNINPYDLDACKKYCQELPFFDQIKKDYDELVWESNYDWTLIDSNITPRDRWAEKRVVPSRTKFSMVPFWFLKPLLDKNPKKIYDLGCGRNLFKKYIPNIIGVSPSRYDSYYDIQDHVDDDYVKGHQNYFESVFSICALHYRPLQEFSSMVNDFVYMVADNGTGFLSINIERMIDCTSKTDLLEQFGTTDPSSLDLDTYIRTKLSDINVNYLIVDIDLSNLKTMGSMDGNIKIVFDKCLK